MTDLVAGRYPIAYEQWLMDGSPYPPYRSTLPSRQFGATTFTAVLTGTAYIYPFIVMPGDVFNYVTLIVKTAQTVGGHAWAAVYNGTTSTATLLAQTADNTTGYGAGSTGALKVALGSAIANSGTVGTPQGPSTAATVNSGPAVWGLVLFNSAASGTGMILDAATVAGDVAGNIALTGQIPVAQTATLTATATAPASLGNASYGTLTASSAAIPYAVLSRQ
jgi:hypothetical protein